MNLRIKNELSDIKISSNFNFEILNLCDSVVFTARISNFAIIF